MSDISKCSETSCMKKDTCRRFTDPAGLNQSYTEPLNFNKKEGCDLHYPNNVVICSECGEYEYETRRITDYWVKQDGKWICMYCRKD